MSEISRELLEQQGSMGKVMRKLFPEAPKISEEEANKLREEEQGRVEKKLAQARAEAILAHVRELGDDY
ncbi:MAG: hypothetical protein M0Z85_03810 [Gammaproteobacteria bacterium]|nr:hypothetical protein [Gammaproteobacteria bacterium]